jgi:hypothetical protein
VENAFDELEEQVRTAGAAAAIERLCALLKEHKDYTGLFYALLLKKRFELGVSPVPTGAAQLLPARVHTEYEEAIRHAAGVAGRLNLDNGRIAAAWQFYRMIGETEPVREAIDRFVPAQRDYEGVDESTGEGEGIQPLVEIAFHQGLHPKKGFDLVLDHFGICNAITLVTGPEFTHGAATRDYCIKRLVVALHGELVERLSYAIEQVEGARPSAQRAPELIAGRDWLFADDMAHIDVSHLSAVVQMSQHLEKSDELEVARALCEYGKHLSPRFQLSAEPPFENQFQDYAVYLAALAGENVDEGVAHFRAKVEGADLEMVGTFSAEVLVNLLVKLGRDQEALQIACRYLDKVDARRLTCPSIVDLCEKTGDYRALMTLARAQNNLVHFVAGLVGEAVGEHSR